MQPSEFIKKWQGNAQKERSASQSHFNDLCALVGQPAPFDADPAGEWFAFEKGALKTGGGDGWADVWKRGCFAWEYKGPRKDLDSAYVQLQRYAVALENPPLLIVSDMQRFRIHTNWTNTVQKTFEFGIEDLADEAVLTRLRHAFSPEDVAKLKPGKTRQELTEEIAEKFARIAQNLRGRGHEPHKVAHFINRMIFCMFAEDVKLLPNHMFRRMLEVSLEDKGSFVDNAGQLFAAMSKKGGKVGYDRVDWFNGGLFDEDDTVFELEEVELEEALAAAKLDWSTIDPSIMGTLFERGLDPGKRSQLGAHYTDREKIMMIVDPVIVDPLTREWAGVREKIAAELAVTGTAQKRENARKRAITAHRGFIDRLRGFRVLDPACGSGNFLYLALQALKDIEHRVNIDVFDMGLPLETPTVGPECVEGIELNPYAAELARVSVWIGEIQWMLRHGFAVTKDPILRTLGTIECRDALLNEDGSRAAWPAADVVVGNPPFIGNKKMIAELGEENAVAVRNAYPEVPGGADFVTYWFAKSWEMIQAGKLKRAGLVSTNSIRGGASRDVLKPIVAIGRIFDAWADEAWTVDGAAVRVSMVCFDGEHGGEAVLDGGSAEEVFSDLTASSGGVDLTAAIRLGENSGKSFQGVSKVGPFEIDGDRARDWLRRPRNVNGEPNSSVLRPWITGNDLTKRYNDQWVVDFGLSMSEHDAAQFEDAFKLISDVVKPLRSKSRREAYKKKWWIHGEARPGMRAALRGLPKFIVTPKVSKHRFFVFHYAPTLPSNLVIATSLSDYSSLGVLSSRFHERWSLACGQWIGVGNDATYTPTTTFETFPFPEGLTPDIPAAEYADDPHAQAIAEAAETLNTLRENWLNPPEWVQREPEVVAGYPDRILPVDDEAAKKLKKRTLTNLYNERPTWLNNAHRDLDAVVAAAYGWPADLDDDAILKNLFELNQLRSQG